MRSENKQRLIIIFLAIPIIIVSIIGFMSELDIKSKTIVSIFLITIIAMLVDSFIKIK